MQSSRRQQALFSIGACLTAVAVTACSGGGGDKAKGKSGAAAGPPEVGFVVVQTSSVPVPVDLAGRTVAYQSSEVRPQVAGLVQKRLFVEGSIVRRGQPLYLIDPRLYRASVNQANANLASAQATAEASRTQAERYKPLADIEAVSKQDYTNALATARENGAAVLQNRAALDTARINLSFTTVPAPISGRIGRSQFTVGALVTTSQTDPLTTIQQLDPMYVDMQQSAGDLLALRRSLAARNGVVPTRAVVRLKLEDGSDYGQTGVVEFSEVVVDQATGTVTLRARFPNARGVLLPGMFVRASFAQAVDQDAFLVPQPAISRDPLGHATLFVVGPDNHAVERSVIATRTQGPDWVVTQGLKPGDKVIVQGLATLKPKQAIRPVPANTAQKIRPPQKGGGKDGGASGGGAGKAGG
ncbi:efflux RND transporter periplasmic adaptor subunit [Sphingomonas bacterium]|uniref:efflux RND transporter periplasmic adaptor subunit n=1 Tax=Sphingomonas bacterium TaxID=1895847 RepID=UPI0020C6534E|nr:efflux RND transporter periplasmic adaptor subunit [Sphingomonas bacterium]